MNPVWLWSTWWKYDLPRAYRAIIATADFFGWLRYSHPDVRFLPIQVELVRAHFARKEGIYSVVFVARGGGKTYVANLIKEYEARK